MRSKIQHWWHKVRNSNSLKRMRNYFDRASPETLQVWLFALYFGLRDRTTIFESSKGSQLCIGLVRASPCHYIILPMKECEMQIIIKRVSWQSCVESVPENVTVFFRKWKRHVSVVVCWHYFHISCVSRFSRLFQSFLNLAPFFLSLTSSCSSASVAALGFSSWRCLLRLYVCQKYLALSASQVLLLLLLTITDVHDTNYYHFCCCYYYYGYYYHL